MIDTVQTLLIHQFEAALATLRQCIDRCPDDAWTEPTGNLPVWRVVSHTLFWTDYYLCCSDAEHHPPAFHRNDEHLQEYLPGDPYTKEQMRSYLSACTSKVQQVIRAESAATMVAPCGFPRKIISRAELYVYNIRHVQHHAAQISLALRRDADVEIDWQRSGTGHPS